MQVQREGLVEEIVKAINGNPSLVLRSLRESLKVCLADTTFRKELVDTLATCVDLKDIEPLYDRALAMRLIPCSLHQFNRITHKLARQLKPPHYRLVGDAHRRHRLFYASDIEKIRQSLSAPYKEGTKLRFSSSHNRAASTGKRGSLALAAL